jgi:pyruvate/2-oxoglutarate/acetoin dehydrogenase E1 component/TPP-dependent pyruvate/acetoin dehydrogenase alpha subunit
MLDTKPNSSLKKSNSNRKKYSKAFREEVLYDFRICTESREASILARKEVLMGRANFGIIGDGKEVAQVAMARAWKKGDFRSGYYRDQTLMMALGLITLEDFFAQLYGDPVLDKMSTGRQMNCHFSTPTIDAAGNWLDHTEQYNVSADISPTAGQMARGLGLAFASKKYREVKGIETGFSKGGNEIAFCTIGDASTSEGVFWETINAAGVLQAPLAVSVWDDGYGISVPKKYQTAKESISQVLSGIHGEGGVDIHIGKGWDYEGLRELYTSVTDSMRKTHRPALFHIQEVTQQLGHSTSGDHRRYKSTERLKWEEEYDCNLRMANWMIENKLATAEEIEQIKKEAKQKVSAAAKAVSAHYQNDVATFRNTLQSALDSLCQQLPDVQDLAQIAEEMRGLREPLRFELTKLGRKALYFSGKTSSPEKDLLTQLIQKEKEQNEDWYSKHLYSETPRSALQVPAVLPQFNSEEKPIDGYEVLNACFDANLDKYKNLFAFGEDVGHIGDVNQGFRGLQEKYGVERVFDTGIREWTIMGQAIGMAMRGLRPIAEIQYLDYLLYGLAALSDDLATLRWRSANQQAAPAIIRTRGHRLVGVWHAGSPMGMMLGSLRGMWICVPRDMTQAAGMYNTLLQSDDPAIVVECLNGYRLKEQCPTNIDEFTVPLGQPDILRTGDDITIITYGSSIRPAMEAADMLAKHDISVEIVDVQTLLPFDLSHSCLRSIQKTNRVLFLDEDVPGGASAFMMQEVLEKQGAYKYLDSAPITLAAKQHRTAYGQDGDYYTKPQTEDIFEAIYQTMQESDPQKW